MKKAIFLFLMFLFDTQLVFGQNSLSLQAFRTHIYEAYVLNNMPRWAQAVTSLETAYRSNYDEEILYDLLLAHYGLIGYYLGNDREREGAVLLDRAQALLRQLESSPDYRAQAYAFEAAFQAFRISLQPMQVLSIGPRSVQAANRAVESNQRYARAWIEKGNIMFFAPSPFGSKKKAIDFYQRAIRIMEENMHPAHHWLYLSTLVSLANSFEKTGNIRMALQTVEKALQFEPRFRYAREELMPRLQPLPRGN